jgi:hypothetical protein
MPMPSVVFPLGVVLLVAIVPLHFLGYTPDDGVVRICGALGGWLFFAPLRGAIAAQISRR